MKARANHEQRRPERWKKKDRRQRRTMGQNQVIMKHPIIHFPTSEGVSEVSERTSERSGGREQSEQSGASVRREFMHAGQDILT